MAKKRFKLSRKKSKKMFTRTALKSHGFNRMTLKPMRGGFRL